jgi:hypothetical protein
MKHRTLGWVAALVLAATLALAQQQMPTGQGMMGMGMMGGCPMMGMMGQSSMQGTMGQGMPGMMGRGMMGAGNMAAQVEGRLAYLRVELGITEAQAAAWKEYAEAVKSRMSGMQSMHQEMMSAMQSGTALDCIRAQIRMMENMVASNEGSEPGTRGSLQGAYGRAKEESGSAPRHGDDVRTSAGWTMVHEDTVHHQRSALRHRARL